MIFLFFKSGVPPGWDVIGLALTVKLCWWLAGAQELWWGRASGVWRWGVIAGLVLPRPHVCCRHLESRVFTWDRTSVLGSSTDRRVEAFRLWASSLAPGYNTSLWPRCNFSSLSPHCLEVYVGKSAYVAKHVFSNHPWKECVFTLHAVFLPLQ